MSMESEPEVEVVGAPQNLSALRKETFDILNQITGDVKGCRTAVRNLTKKLKSKAVSTDKGLSFLEMKNHTVLSYLMSLSGLLQEKVQGNSIIGSPFLDQLVECRTVLEKIRPTDIKLKYKVDKLVRTAVEGKTESDPLRFKANLDNLSTERNGEQAESDDSDVDLEPEMPEDPEMSTSQKNLKDKADGIYRPPRVAPQYFDDKTTTQTKSDDKFKRKTSGAIIRELQEQFLDTPVEIHNMGDAYAKQLSRETLDKQKYEETYMTRLPMTKAQKHKENALSTIGVLGDELTDFSERGKSGSGSGKGKGTKRKLSSGGKGKNRGRGSGKKKKFRK